jgi:ABC-type transport system involved in cytochrome bd biosynthesis fused ATPase/permease subunit
LLADFPVLVLDEPTEHLDEPTAAALMTDLLTQTGDRTVLLVTHRWSDLSRFNRVLRLSAGRMSLLV